MKQANNNEVDLLLRALAKGRDASSLQNGSASRDGSNTSSVHLDADELNSYAEGVVPTAARARYTEHLADCDACRGIVVSLTQAAGTAARHDVMENKGGLAFWQKLTALFSPPVLRYAVPALVLLAVIGISLLALRKPQQPDLIALNHPADSSTSAGQVQPAESTVGQSSSTATSPTQKGSELPTTTNSVKERNNLKDKNTQAGQGAGTGEKDVTSAPVAKGADQPRDATTLSELRPSYAPEPKSAAPAAAQKRSEVDAISIAKEQPANREEQERRRDDVFKSQPGDEHGPNRSAAPRAAGVPLAGRQVGGLMGSRAGPNTQDKKAKAAEVETRTVSGKRFARDGDTWIDVDYESSRATIKVARGSEQFRALVADEPGLGAIAQQLNGAVIVVWRNRAYRIQ